MKIKSFILGFLVSALVFTSTSVFGASLFKTIDVVPNVIKVVVDGKQIVSDNFVYQGTTYVPIRNIASSLGEDVNYDKPSNTAYIGEYVIPVEDTVPTAPPEPIVTMGQKNALNSAYTYLDYTAFSYSSLVEQLEYEGFSNADAVYAVDRCGADWNEQAAKKAADYLDYGSFSREGLITQLEYEGFSSEQAAYGAGAVGY